MNADTKRHIDSARQVLVGVVPNPTSQIDQITFMYTNWLNLHISSISRFLKLNSLNTVCFFCFSHSIQKVDDAFEAEYGKTISEHLGI